MPITRSLSMRRNGNNLDCAIAFTKVNAERKMSETNTAQGRRSNHRKSLRHLANRLQCCYNFANKTRTETGLLRFVVYDLFKILDLGWRKKREPHFRSACALRMTSSPDTNWMCPASSSFSRRSASSSHKTSSSAGDKASRLSSSSWASFARSAGGRFSASRSSVSIFMAVTLIPSVRHSSASSSNQTHKFAFCLDANCHSTDSPRPSSMPDNAHLRPRRSAGSLRSA